MNDKQKDKPAPDISIEDYVINTGDRKTLPSDRSKTIPSPIEALLKAQKQRSINQIKGKLT